MDKLKNTLIEKKELEAIKIFEKKIEKFLKFIPIFSIKNLNDEKVFLSVIMGLQKELNAIKEAMEDFLNSNKRMIRRIEKLEFSDKNERKNQKKNFVKKLSSCEFYNSMVKESKKSLLKNENYFAILFHLSEIIEGLNYSLCVLKEAKNKKINNPDILLDYIVDLDVEFRYHLLGNHINNFVVFEKKKKEFSVGILTSIDRFLADYGHKNSKQVGKRKAKKAIRDNEFSFAFV